MGFVGYLTNSHVYSRLYNLFTLLILGKVYNKILSYYLNLSFSIPLNTKTSAILASYYQYKAFHPLLADFYYSIKPSGVIILTSFSSTSFSLRKPLTPPK